MNWARSMEGLYNINLLHFPDSSDAYTKKYIHIAQVNTIVKARA